MVADTVRQDVKRASKTEDASVGELVQDGNVYTFISTNAGTIPILIEYNSGSTTSLTIEVHEPGLDETFGGSEGVLVPFNIGNDNSDSCSSLSIQSDGKIVVAGQADHTNPTNTNFAVARLETTGTLDESFGTDGKQHFQIATAGGNAGNIAYDVALTESGKIVLAGKAGGKIALARLTRGGILDGTFGSSGKMQGSAAGEFLSGVVSLSESSFIAGGTSNNVDTTVLRSNGDINSISMDQRIVVDENHLINVLAQHESQFYLAGAILNNFIVARYEDDGDPDNTFFTFDDGTPPPEARNYKTIDLSGTDTAYALAVQTDGKIVLAGTGGPGGTNGFALTRTLTNATGATGATSTPDLSFGGGSRVVGNGAYKDVALLDDGKIVAVGQSASEDSAIAIYTTNGAFYRTPLTPASSPGVASPAGDGGVLGPSVAADGLNAVAIDNVGRIVAAGFRTVGGNSDFLVVRYWP